MNKSIARILRYMKRLLLIATPLLALSMLHAAEVPAVGAKAIDFSLRSQTGKNVRLKDFRGQWVVLYFYPKDMTQGCTVEAHNFQRDLVQYSAKRAVIVGISADTVDSHQHFCTKESLTFRLLADPTKQVISQYGSLALDGSVALRNTFLIDPQGVVRKVYLGVNSSQHSHDVLADLAELEK